LSPLLAAEIKDARLLSAVTAPAKQIASLAAISAFG
jgi:hypothetical protein